MFICRTITLSGQYIVPQRVENTVLRQILKKKSVFKTIIKSQYI